MFTPSSQRVRSLRLLMRVAMVSIVATTSVAACGGTASDPADTIAVVKGAGSKQTKVQEFGEKVASAALKAGLKAASRELEDTTFDNGRVEVSDIVVRQSGKTRVGSATITFKDSEMSLAVSFSVEDKDNWTMTAKKTSSSAASKYTPKQMPDLVIDRSQVSGTIGMTDGELEWNLTGPTVNWTWNKSVTIAATIGFSNQCPFDDDAKCPAGKNIFVTMPSMQLGMTSPSLSVSGVGGFSLSQPWMRIESSAGDVMLNKDNGVKNANMVMWVGKRKDSFDKNLQLPDLATLNKGLNAEFCGDFSLKIPKIGNKATSGCARWSTEGFVIGQLGTGGEVSTDYSSTELKVSETSITKVAGAAFNTLSAAALKSLPNPTVAFNGAVAKLANASVSIGGTTQGIPGNLLRAVGQGDKVIEDLKNSQVNIGGVISADSLDLTVSAPISGTLGDEPMKLTLQTLQLNLKADSSKNASLDVSVVADTTFGYGTTSAPFVTTISLVAQVGTDTGLGLVVNAHGVPSTADANRTGNTNDDKLTDPAHATWVWENAFDIPGYNLWNMTTQVGIFKGSPQFGYNSTGYINPTNDAMDKMVTCGDSNATQTKVNEPCAGSDWLMSQLVTSISVTEPCFAWAFDGGSTGTTLSFSQGAVRTQKFKIGYAPRGCTVGTGDDEVVLPKAFAGFQFVTKIGGATAAFAFKTSTDGLTAMMDLENVKLGAFTYDQLSLKSVIHTDGTSETTFVSDISFDSGNFTVAGELTTGKDGMYQKLVGDIDVSGESPKGSWKFQDNSDGGKDRFSVNNLHFEETMKADGSGTETEMDLSGSIRMKNANYDLVNSHMKAVNGVLRELHFEFVYTHTVNGNKRRARFLIDYHLGDGEMNFVGRMDLRYTNKFDKEIGGYKYVRHLDISVYLEMDLDLVAEGGKSQAVFKVGGTFDGANISGGMNCEARVSTSPDFHCRGTVKFYKKNVGHASEDWNF